MKIKTTVTKPSYKIILHRICECSFYYYRVKGWPLYTFTICKSGQNLRLRFSTTSTLESLPKGLVAQLEQLEVLLKRWGYLKGQLIVNCQHYDLGVESQREAKNDSQV